VGLPVVTAPVGDCAERLRDVQPSLVVPRSAESFADAAEAVLAARSRSNGRETIARTLSLDAVAKRVLAVYERALEATDVTARLRVSIQLKIERAKGPAPSPAP